jgi:phosphoribosylaminoimidazole-succinocarboxamide synthase
LFCGADYAKIEEYTRKLFAYGSDEAAKRGLILVDTKYEFGMFNGEIYLIDEVHTPDSSRYFYAEDYEIRQQREEKAETAVKRICAAMVNRQWISRTERPASAKNDRSSSQYDIRSLRRIV